MRELIVGRQSAGFIERGHPWVRHDRFTKGLASLTSGEAVTVVDDRGRGLASALIDRDHASICARIYHRQPAKPFVPLEALDKAWLAREPLRQRGDTSCYRVVHGEGDFLPGLRIECYGDHAVILVLSAAASSYAETIGHRLRELMGGKPTIIIREHFDDLRRHETRSRLLGGGPCDIRATVDGSELGVAVTVTPGAGLATGIYVDQRETRRWLGERCRGMRILNLFAYTGVFSVGALVHGAESAHDVDLSLPSLATAERNARLNGVQARYFSTRGDCMGFCQENPQQFDCIICDPPTAAGGGSGGWVARRDYPLMLAAVRERAAPGALLLACVNTIGGKPFDLAAAVAEAGFRPLPAAEQPPLGLDLPQRRGFPEGLPFRLVAARLRS